MLEGPNLWMKSSTTPNFWRAYRALTPKIQAEARKAYQLWRATPPDIRHFTLSGKVITGRFASSAAGGHWHDSTKMHTLLVLDRLARRV
jgi:hypothetical protein